MKRDQFPLRILLVFASFMLTVLLYIDRACISAAKEEISSDLQFDLTDFGWVMAMFTLGYALFQTPSGKWADRRGPRSVIAAIVSLWSLLTAMTGAAWNFISMLVIRFLFGAGEAGAFPSLAKVVYNWFPVKERGIVQGINFSGSRIGAAFALPLVAFIIGSVGWRMTFLIFGLAGILFAVLWYWLFRNDPRESGAISEREKKYILENREKPSGGGRSGLAFGTILASRNMWLAMLQYMASNFTFYFTLTWMYPYLKDRFALGGVEAGLYAMVPLLAGAIGNWASGFWVDRLYRKRNLAISRRLPAITGFILAAIGMLMMARIDSPQVAIIFLSIAIFGADMTLSPSWAFCIDIGKENAGAVSGTMNMAGNLGAFVTIIAFPYLYEWTGSFQPFFYVCMVLSAIAIALWLSMDPLKAIVNNREQRNEPNR
jgi:ACS family glucarate transporter-like MFS transporter